MKRILAFAICIFVLGACAAHTPVLIPIKQAPVTQIAATSAPVFSQTEAVGFPLAGSWSGTAKNGDFSMQVTLTIASDCQAGAPCGSFDLPTIPCKGTYILLSAEEETYLFDITDRSSTCGIGQDSMRLLPDGSLEWISRGDYGVDQGILYRAPENANPNALPVIFDDDGSPDGTTALLYLLSDPAASVRAVVISHGEAHPRVYIQNMGRVLDAFGFGVIPLGYGSDSALIPGQDFPEWLRTAADGFWGHALPNASKSYPVQNAANLIVDLLSKAEQPMAVFVSGACTDLALALRMDPAIASRISRVYIMGGAVTAKGNMSDFYPDDPNKVAEWNIFVDPLAASEVFQSGIPITLVPLDATNLVSTNMSETSQWRKGGAIADLAADFYEGLLGGSPTAQMCLWDVMTAVIMLHPELCPLTPLSLEVVTDAGNYYGQTHVVQGGVPNVDVCLQPDVAGIRQMLVSQFSSQR